MSEQDWPVGTVATVTIGGNVKSGAMRAVANGRGAWISDRLIDGAFLHEDRAVTDVRPLIVLDLDPTVVREDMGATRNEHQRFVDMIREAANEFWTPDAATLARKVADQIESQVKPPRIPEPGLWGVVEAGHEVLAGRHKFIRHGGAWFVPGIQRAMWDELVDPVLIRPGIEDAS